MEERETRRGLPPPSLFGKTRSKTQLLALPKGRKVCYYSSLSEMLSIPEAFRLDLPSLARV